MRNVFRNVTDCEKDWHEYWCEIIQIIKITFQGQCDDDSNFYSVDIFSLLNSGNIILDKKTFSKKVILSTKSNDKAKTQFSRNSLVLGY